jgi:hypothetical protein
VTRQELEVIRSKMAELQSSTRYDTAYMAKSVALSLYVEPLITALEAAWEELSESRQP